MTSSRSRTSRSRVLAVALVVLLGLTGSALASRKRVVVLPFEGEKAEKFHDAVVKLIKKTHTVLSSAKWASTAEGMSADSGSDKDIKKVAKKLKIDGVVEGKIEKRRNEYIIRLKLHAGTTGAMSKSVNTKAENIKLDGDAATDIKDELVSAIGELETNRTSNDDLDSDSESSNGDDEKPAKEDKKKKFDKKAAASEGDDEEEAKPVKEDKKKKFDKKAVEEDEPAKDEKKDEKKDKKGFGKKKGGDEEAEALKTKKDEPAESDENPLPEEKEKKPKKVAKKEKEKEEGSDEGVSEKADVNKKTGDEARTAAERAIDAVAGLSITTRRLTWATDADLVQKPPAYKGLPAPGGMFDLTFYPLNLGHKASGIKHDLGASVMYEQALLISSKDQDGNKLQTAYSRYAIGGVFRHALGSTVIGGTLKYGRQSFQIQNSDAIGIPNVNYSMFSPGGFVRYPLNPKITLNFDLAALLVLKTGQMQLMQNYGGASVLGFEGEAGGDYALSGKIFVRAGLKVESIGYSFNGKGVKTNADADPEQDVQGARDTYIGVVGTLGYIY